MVELITTLAGEISNSYTDTGYADDYWANHWDTAGAAQWAALTDDQKTNLFVQACRTIESARFTYLNTLPQYSIHYDRRTGKVHDMNLTRDPVKYYYYQRLQFPRNLDVYYMNPPTGSNIGDIYIPEPVMMAQCEQAVYLLNLDQTAIANRLQGITMEKIGIGRQQIDTTQEYGMSGSMFSPRAHELVSPYLVRGGQIRRC